ncbi:MAG: tyrosine-type recombinase/integrase [Eubacteriales bacterium]|nr:tyrosine-type recombinase/integrase [Eubacteriales bacterium]
MAYNEKTRLYCKKIKDRSSGKWIPVYGHTKEETRRKARAREAELAAEADLRENPPFWTYARQWYELHKGDYSSKRQQDYKNAINNHICPRLGSKRIRDVTYSDVRLVMADVAESSKSLQQKIVTAMRKIFDAAVKDKIIEESPCAALKPGGQEAPEKEALTRAQQRALLSSVRDCPIYPFVALCLYTGLRREEALGLQWSHVHLDAPAPWLDVRTSCDWNGKNQPELTTLLKSDAAYRSIPLPPPLVEILKDLQKAQKGPCVICRGEGELLSAAAFRRRWSAVTIREEHTLKRTMRGKTVEQQLRVGDPVPYHKGVAVTMDFHTTPHLLRHTYISELILSGVAVKRVQYLAGHSSPIQTLKIYTHLMENKPEDLYGEVLKAFSDQIPD